ncbi:MAG: serine/threonine protein kinase [Archangium sp.]|nr:serine/threonine protein kinase [Archangium sp.]
MPPTPFGPYELLDCIATGGMAEIHRARRTGDDTPLVIKKILPAYAASERFIKLLTNEARIAMSLSHPNVVRVVDFGDVDGEWYLAMELVDGQPLSRIVKRAAERGFRTLPHALSVHVLVEMLKGLHAAHIQADAEGRPLHVVHRDVSPQNVLIGYDGTVKVTDFGLARADVEGRDPKESRTLKGKFSYFAPEQARSKPLDARTDVFAAGVVLYELLTGRLPFQGSMNEVLSAIGRGTHDAPRAVAPTLHPDLEHAVEKALSTEKSERFPSAQAFERALASFVVAHAPGLGASQLGPFVSLLFEDELRQAGRTPAVTPEFRERADWWKVSAADGIEAESEPATELVSTAPAPPPPEKRKPGTRVILAVAAATAVVGSAGLFAAVRLLRGSIDVAATPPNATVWLDGARVADSTPALIPNLAVRRAYHLEVRADGHLPWGDDVTLGFGEHRHVVAALRPAPVDIELQVDSVSAEEKPTRAPVPPAPPPPATPKLETVKLTAAPVVVDVAAHRTVIAAKPLLIDARKSYRVALNRGPFAGWVLLARTTKDVRVFPLAGTVPIAGATELTAVRIEPSSFGQRAAPERKPRVLTATALKAAPKRASVAPTPPARGGLTVTGLDPRRAYEVIAQRSEAPAQGALVVGHPARGIFALRPDVPLRITGTKQLWLSFVSAATAPSGTLSVVIRAVPTARRR